MRAFWTSALCGLMLHAPAMAQESGQASDPPVAVENAQTEEPISVDPSTQPSEAIPGKPDPFAVLASATVGPVAGYTYFHRAGATLADQRADLAACRPAILAMTYPGPSTTGGVGYYDPMAGIHLARRRRGGRSRGGCHARRDRSWAYALGRIARHAAQL